jgi:uncharacterized protein YkwD
MNKSILIGLLLALVVLFAISCGPSAPVKTYETIFNEYRVENGLPPLEFTAELNAVAQQRVEEIKVSFTHTRMGEIIAMGMVSDSDALECWKASPPHNTIMLDSRYGCTGYARSGGYAVQVFR